MRDGSRQVARVRVAHGGRVFVAPAQVFNGATAAGGPVPEAFILVFVPVKIFECSEPFWC